MQVSDFEYYLPEKLIAQHPTDKRDASRLLVLHRKNDTVEDKHFYDVVDYLNAGDCLVMNNSKVIPARLFGVKKNTGAKIEFLLIKRKAGDIWETLVKPGKKLHPGDSVLFQGEHGEELEAEVLSYGEDGTRMVQFHYSGDFLALLDEIGTIPLPPYIDRKSEAEDKERYQTVYCQEEGSVAAPTAGLHFTKELLEKARKKGVQIAYVTLHVGIGTFRPVKCDVVEEHRMHFEEYHIDEENARLINDTKKNGGRIVSVGTTSTRTLESAAQENGLVKAGHGNTDIFIYPGYQFQVIDCLITNFHLPKSTLLMLISALYDKDKMMKIYEDAVKKEYRFFSYGDAMFIE
ncbi:tRNA preQ1(34) S-adenosylmethionine ribosyltransferase-isomerase QueA [Sinanaerobacter sp. ZZT-01]|uniref:tRNA preQ1(34) S-adenosylmethionine ribosyltransferase-isomerase QueA n=1 Tax=Sinanaerobacter sp. ZZT-01 TaxID=3111540 RepID=UPI002D787768|nr:tRNA preQ1(34) S-adenosylmethionine ribosyltransferase-isomerase QueA [Sinanaerobacter sp. ZZT-01]WRR92923.1 tRNA preQ1(34) S-adenosylmethionine ribosyltransferase-isomerase QueA [Sinanaerobacter sp. ZZT-01]